MEDRLEEVRVEAGTVRLPGTLGLPPASGRAARGVVVFAHGSGSSRLSPRNQRVAETLRQHGCATLLLDLLTPDEGGDRRNVFDINLLGDRLTGAVRWLASQALATLPVGLFGASTGAAAALVAAAQLGKTVAAVVSRGGRPDLAAEHLAAVTAPTLLIVGSLDETVLRLNREAMERLRCRKELLVVRGATHLFEEAGALDRVAAAAGQWFAEAFGEREVRQSGRRPGSPGRRA